MRSAYEAANYVSGKLGCLGKVQVTCGELSRICLPGRKVRGGKARQGKARQGKRKEEKAHYSRVCPAHVMERIPLRVFRGVKWWWWWKTFRLLCPFDLL